MTRKTKRASQLKKTTRFESLSNLRANQPNFYAAIERRQEYERARLETARKRYVKTTGYPSTSAIERRRQEYLEIPVAVAPPTPPRVLVASLATAFALPIIVAVATNVTHPNVVARVHSLPNAAATANVAARVYSRPTAAPRSTTVSAEVAPPSVPPQTSVAASANVPASNNVAASPNVATPVYSRPIAAPTASAAAPVYPGPSTSPAQPNVAVAPIAQTQPQPRAAEPTHSKVAAARVNSTQASSRKTSPGRASLSAPLSSRILASVLRVIFGTNQQPAPVTKPARHPAQRLTRLDQAAAHKRPVSPWSINPDGTWTAIVHAPSTMRYPAFAASSGQLIQLEPSALEGNAALVRIGWSRPIAVTISSTQASESIALPAPDDEPEAFEVTARAIGPHLVNLGWTPLGSNAAVTSYEVYRASGEGERAQLIAVVPPGEHALHDRDVDPGSQYRYSVVAQLGSDPLRASTPTISTPGELPASSSAVLSGKGMFLYFSSLAYDARSFRNYKPEKVIVEAQRAGIHVIELRMARGSCAMAQTPQARAWLDRLIDAAAHASISLIAWTVPRRVTTEDVAQTVAAAAYTTPEGNGFVGVALDLETGDRYMGSGAQARESMVRYIDEVRTAVGPRYLIVATVTSPEMGHHTNDDYPYAGIAAFADVLQPMEYWHYFGGASHHEYARDEVAGAAEAAVARTRELAGRDIPVNVAGQSVDLEGTGAPSGREISWSLGGAKSVGAIGETFFDWAGTPPDAWAAIQAFDW